MRRTLSSEKLAICRPQRAALTRRRLPVAILLCASCSARLAAVRQGVQTRRASAAKVDDFYTQMANVGSALYRNAAISAPDAVVGVDEITALDLFAVPDLHSRLVGLGAGWVMRGAVTRPERLVLAQLAGAYRNQLQALVSRLTQPEQVDYSQLAAGRQWQLATSGEDDLARQGTLTMPLGSWLAAENSVSGELLRLWRDNLRHDLAAAVAASNQILSRSVIVGAAALALAVAAFASAILLSNGLVRRLRRLRTRTLELADVTLPSMVRRIGDGEPVDVVSEMAVLDYGRDEIGQVAEAFNTAQRTAAAAAATEAATRAGVNKVFLDIAHRSQLVVRRQLELLDIAEAKQGDPEHLELLFQLDHLATRARRNAENLLILGGGQPGGKWRTPEALEDIVRSAVSEIEQFARVTTVRLPEVKVLGAVVADLIHLLAELVDNATSFSPPESAVWVRGNVVGKGVVVEVEDQGLGIEFDERERLNRMLRVPPDFRAMAVAGQRHLGLFVVGQLAKQHTIAVSLLESAYGGVKAIVLIPSNLVEAGKNGDPHGPGHARQQGQPPGVPSEAEPDLVPWPLGKDRAGSLGRSAGGPTAEPPSGSSTQTGFSFFATAPSPRDSALSPVATPSARTRPPLPRRERQASLVPQLRRQLNGGTDGTAARRIRSPEEARGSMSAFQRGTRRGRDASGQHHQ